MSKYSRIRRIFQIWSDKREYFNGKLMYESIISPILHLYANLYNRCLQDFYVCVVGCGGGVANVYSNRGHKNVWLCSWNLNSYIHKLKLIFQKYLFILWMEILFGQIIISKEKLIKYLNFYESCV